MTFRVDDLFVTVLPEFMADAAECGCTKCTSRTGGPTPCGSEDDQTRQACVDCQKASCGNDSSCNDTNCIVHTTSGSATWRDEQFGLLSRELEAALSR